MPLSKITNLSITDDTILNADINSSAAIAKTKLASLDVVNADVNASAAIAMSKLATDPTNASNLASGTVPTARLGTGTASSSVFLAGDNSWAAAGAKIGQVLQNTTTTYTNISSTTYSNPLSQAITPVASSSKVLVIATANHGVGNESVVKIQAKIWRVTDAAGTEDAIAIGDIICLGGEATHNEAGRSTVGIILDSPNETNAVTYKYVFRGSSANATYYNNYTSSGQNTGTITLMEILA